MTSALRHLHPSNKRQDSIAPWLKKSQRETYASKGGFWCGAVEKRLVAASVRYPDQAGLHVERLEVCDQARLIGGFLPHLSLAPRVRGLFLSVPPETNVTFQNCDVKLLTRNGFKLFRVSGETSVRGLTRAGEGLGA